MSVRFGNHEGHEGHEGLLLEADGWLLPFVPFAFFVVSMTHPGGIAKHEYGP